MNWRWPVLAAVFLVGFFFAWKIRQYPWQLGLLVGLAIVSLAYVTLRVIEDLWPLWRSGNQAIPRKENPGEHEKKMGRHG